MNAKKTVYLDDQGSSFIEALKVWTQYLDGKLGWEPQTTAAHHLFKDMMKAPWSPGRAPTAEEMKNLEALAPVMDIWKNMPNLFTPRMFAALMEKFKPAIEYVNSTMGVNVTAIQVPEPRPIRQHVLPPFDWLVKHIALLSGGEAPKFSGGVAARQDKFQPTGFPIKGNLDSMKYHLPRGKWYDRTVAEIWFADEESAKKAGFEPARE